MSSLIQAISARATFTGGLEQRAKAAYQQQRQQIALTLQPLLSTTELQGELDALVPPQVWYQSFSYRTTEFWSCQRRVVCKLTYDAQGTGRFVSNCSKSVLKSVSVVVGS
jgi:hypothetical protein